MKVVILVGGMGTRLSEDTQLRPKPMVEIGGKPILWHIMKLYSQYNFKEFILCLGYKGYMIKEYFHHYLLHQSDVQISNGEVFYINKKDEDWNVMMIDTGLYTQTGGRLRRIRDFLEGQDFMLTYGDGVCNVDLNDLLWQHSLDPMNKSGSPLVTMTTVQPPGRFGSVEINPSGLITNFSEKQKSTWINGGFFVCNNASLNYIDGDDTQWEAKPLRSLAEEGYLHAYQHKGFWKCMDNLRDKNELEDLWNSGNAPWKVWG